MTKNSREELIRIINELRLRGWSDSEIIEYLLVVYKP